MSTSDFVALGLFGVISYYALTHPLVKNSGTLSSSSSCNYAPASEVPSSLLPKESLTSTTAFAPNPASLLQGKSFMSPGTDQQGVSTQLNKNPWVSLQPQVQVPVGGVSIWGLSSYLVNDDYVKASTGCPQPIQDVGYKAVDSANMSAYQLPGVKNGSI